VALQNPDKNGDPVTVTAASRHGTGAGDFIITLPTLPFTVPANTKKTLTVAFQPSVPGLRSGYLELDSNACATPALRIGLAGTGVVPKISVDPNPVDAGGAVVGKPGPLVPVTITDVGGAPLNVSAVQLLGDGAADFELSGMPIFPATVAPKGTLVFNVRVTPHASGPTAATINVLSDDPDTPSASVPVSGNGGIFTSPSPEPSVSPSSTQFVTPTPSTSAAAHKAGAGSDSLAIGLVIGGVLAAFTALFVARGVYGVRDDD